MTGACGFIATSIVKNLLDKDYRVRGTVRSLKITAKTEHLKNLSPKAADNLELVEADLLDSDSWKRLVIRYLNFDCPEK